MMIGYWISESEVAGIAKLTGGISQDKIEDLSPDTLDEITELSLKMIREVVLKGYMKIGELKKESGFHEWPGSPEETVSKVEGIWRSLNHYPHICEICWLSITQKGEDELKTMGGPG